jgi:hypothetical protein
MEDNMDRLLINVIAHFLIYRREKKGFKGSPVGISYLAPGEAS